MSITDELRDCIRTANRSYEDVRNPYCDREILHIPEEELLKIADRIDTEHQKTMDEWKARDGQMWLKGYSECRAEIAEGNDAIARDLEENGWVRLPLDADGIPIHIGDRVENNERVARIVLTDGSWEPSVYIEKLPNVLHEHFCHEISHYHKPTVEDVLREIVHKCQPTYSKDGSYTTGLTKEEFAEYAAKLRLAKEDE